ncbi:MAG: hypothetical protein P8078_10785, partial [bacterium]
TLPPAGPSLHPGPPEFRAPPGFQASPRGKPFAHRGTPAHGAAVRLPLPGPLPPGPRPLPSGASLGGGQPRARGALLELC